MGHNDRHTGKIDGHIIEVHGIRVLETSTTTAAHARTNARMPCVEYCWQAGLSNHFIKNICTAIVRIECLHRRMKFEASHAEVLNQAAGLSCPQLALRRIDTGEWN